MRILVDITHPAHAHFFRHAVARWRERGHQVVLTSRGKDITAPLLARLGLEHEDLGAAAGGVLGLTRELVTRTRRLRASIRRHRPDVLTAIGGVFIAQAGWLTGVPSVVFYDTENATLSNLLTYPVCTQVVTPRCYRGWVPRAKHRTYAGYHELAYTHPRRFTPDPARLPAFGLRADQPFIVMRLVAWQSAHDTRDHGFTSPEEAVRRLARFGRVVISSERPLPPALAPLRLTGPLEDVHHVLAFARLYIGESATMASESATLGTPALLVSTTGRGYTDEQEARYGLTYTFRHPRTGQGQAVARAEGILTDPGARAEWQGRRGRMLEETVDVTEEIVSRVEAHGPRA